MYNFKKKSKTILKLIIIMKRQSTQLQK